MCAAVAKIVAEHDLEIALGHDAVGLIAILTGPEQAVALAWRDLLIAQVPYMFTKIPSQIVIRSPLCERPIFS